jgi:hypothetical protein
MVDPVHTCAVCPRAIQRGLLMCARHWRMVPAAIQADVYRTYKAWGKAPLAGSLALRREYLKARQAAIDAVKPTAPTPTTGEPT